MKLVQCDICEEKILPEDAASSSCKRIDNILKSLHEKESDSNYSSIDTCPDCAYDLVEAFDDAVDKWKQRKGKRE